MAMYYYASKISAIACGTRCRQSVLQKSRGQRDRDKFAGDDDGDDEDNSIHHRTAYEGTSNATDAAYTLNNLLLDPSDAKASAGPTAIGFGAPGTDGVRYRRRHSEQLDAYGVALAFQNIEVSGDSSAYDVYGYGQKPTPCEAVQYDVPRNVYNQLQRHTANCDVNYENSVVGSGGIMYINGKIVSGPLESLIEALLPKSLMDLDKEFIFSFLLSSRLFLRPHELLGKLLSSVPDCESLEALVALLAEWTNKFPYDYRDERMMNHVKHIVARCSSTLLEAVVSEILSALLKRLTHLERHEEDLRACQTTAAGDKTNATKTLECPTSSQYAQILCRLEKKLAKHIGPEEFLQCSSNILLDKQKKWDQPSSTGGPPGAQDPKKTCNLETYLDWSARLRLFVCNEILRCSGIRDRSKTVELWSGVAQYCLLVGNYNSATAILETLESPPIARLKITWSKLQVTCQQLDCMQRHAEGHGDLWHKQASVLNENHQQHQQKQRQRQQKQKHPHHHAQQKTEVTTTAAATTAVFLSSATASPSTSANVSASPSMVTTTTTASAMDIPETQQPTAALATTSLAGTKAGAEASGATTTTISPTGLTMLPVGNATDKVTAMNEWGAPTNEAYNDNAMAMPVSAASFSRSPSNSNINNKNATSTTPPPSTTSSAASSASTRGAAAVAGAQAKPNDWVVIPVFADIVKLALAGREDCLQRLPNDHINIAAFDRMAAIVGAFTRHMHAVKPAAEMSPGEYETFCRHMQQASQLNESELMMASFDCEEPNNAEKLMYDLN